MKPFEEVFKQHKDRHCSKWHHYFKLYDIHLSHLTNKKFTLLEIGISNGGSLQLWKKYFGPQVTVLGIDINPNSYFKEEQIHTLIGNQTDTNFLSNVLKNYDTPTVIIDDGSHVQSHVLKTFDFLYPLLSNNGIYIIEDCHTSYWPRFEGGINSHLNVVDIMSRNVHDVNTKWFNLPRPAKLHNLDSMHFYDSMIVFEKKDPNIKRMMVDVDNYGPRIVESV